MKNIFATSWAGLILGLLLSNVVLARDRIELTDGSVINGKLISADDGKFKVETDFAGTIEIKQAMIRTLTTDDAVNVGLKPGNIVQGRMQPASAGVAVVAPEGEVQVPAAAVTSVWRVGTDSPKVRAAEEARKKALRKWSFEASTAVAGRSGGGSQKFDANFGFKATLASDHDKLILTLAEENATDSGVATSNRQYGSADYSAFYSPENGWYARTSLERDKIKALDLRSSTALGFGHQVLKTKAQDLVFRLGVNYLDEAYTNQTSFSSPGLDLAVLHSYQFASAKLVNALSYTPAFKQFSNYRMHQESSLELPLGPALWRLKLGVANDFNSAPPAGTARLDTTYFTSLLLNWK